MHSLLLPCLQVAKEQKQRGVFGSNACALPKLRPAPFFCHEKAHMHSELLCKQQKGQRLSEIPHRAQINTRSPINFSPSHPDWERSEVEGLLPVLRVAARCCPHPCDTGAPHPTAPYHSSPCSPPGQWVAHGGGTRHTATCPTLAARGCRPTSFSWEWEPGQCREGTTGTPGLQASLGIGMQNAGGALRVPGEGPEGRMGTVWVEVSLGERIWVTDQPEAPAARAGGLLEAEESGGCQRRVRHLLLLLGGQVGRRVAAGRTAGSGAGIVQGLLGGAAGRHGDGHPHLAAGRARLSALAITHGSSQDLRGKGRG